MPPLYAQDPLGAANAALRSSALDLPMATLLVACEPWMLVLLALALFSWLEGEVRGVLKAFAPGAAAILAAAGVALLARAVGAAPRPLGAGGLAPLLAAAFPSPHAAGVAALATFSLLAYGRRALAVLFLVAVCAGVRIRSGGHWPWDLAAGGALGGVSGLLTYAAALQAFPGGHLARLRARRRAGGSVEPSLRDEEEADSAGAS